MHLYQEADTDEPTLVPLKGAWPMAGDNVSLTINGIPAEEYNRLVALARRPLKPDDLPEGEWSDRLHRHLFLRADGAIVEAEGATPFGWITPDGVDWVRG